MACLGNFRLGITLDITVGLTDRIAEHITDLRADKTPAIVLIEEEPRCGGLLREND
jgi:hypothetical protein